MYHRILLAASIAAVSSASASVYVTDFGAPFPGNPTGWKSGETLSNGRLDNGVAWTQSAPNFESTSPSAWIGTIGSSTTAGVAVGGFYDIPPGDPFSASRTIGGPLANTTLDLNFAIQGSSVSFPDQNDFSITVESGMGGNLFTLDFAAAAPGFWNISWTSALAGGAANFAAVGADAVYGMELTFTPDGGDMDFNLSIQGSSGSPFGQSGTLTGGSGATFSELELGFTQGAAGDYGDNFIVVQGVPEPGSVLLLGLGAIGFLRRRR